MTIKRRVLTVNIPDGAGDGNYNLLRVPTGHEYTVEKAYAFSNLDVAASTANYVQANLMNGGAAGTGTTVISGTVGGTAGWALNAPKELVVIDGSGKLTEGEWLVAKIDEEGTTAPGTIGVCIEYVDGIGANANA